MEVGGGEGRGTTAMRGLHLACSPARPLASAHLHISPPAPPPGLSVHSPVRAEGEC